MSSQKFTNDYFLRYYMDEIKYCIRSHKRSEAIKNKTLSFLNYNNIPKKQIYIFVGEEEIDTYKESLGSEYNILYGGSKGIAYCDNKITEYFDEDEKIVLMDDDIKEIYELFMRDQKEKNPRNDKRLLPSNLRLLDFQLYIKDGFDLLETYNLTLFGMYPVCNSYFMKNTKPIELDLNFIIGRISGYLNKKDIIIKDDCREDYERSILHFKNVGGVLRFNHTCCEADTYVGKGGLAESRTNEKMEQSVNYMLTTYPDIVSRKKCKSQYSEIRLKKVKSSIK